MASKPKHPYTIVRGGKLLDIAKRKAQPADILIKGDTIAEIGRPGLAAPAGAAVVDARNRLMHPGLINAHTHSPGNLGKGMGDLWSLELLLTASQWIGSGRTLEDKHLSAMIGAAEMVMKGCTAAYDLAAEFPLPSVDGLSAMAKAYEEVGMRAVLAPMVADITFFEAIPGLMERLSPALQKEVESFRYAPWKAITKQMNKALQKWPFEKVSLAVAPTIPHHCSDAFMRACAQLAREFGVGLHSHIQESKAQVIVGLKTYGKTQTAHLQDLGLLGPDFVAAHGVWLDDDDIRRLADHGASVAHNPGSNMLLGNGIAAVKAMLRRKLNVGIGTDGAACCDNQNMYESMRVASYGSKAQGPDTEHWLATEEILTAATEGSARALGLGDRLGKIAKRFKADLVFIDLTHVNWIPLNDPTNQLVHTEDGTGVHSVMVGGKMVVENRRPVGVDFVSLARKAEAARERLTEANAGNKQLFQRLEGLVNAFCPGLAKTPYHIDRFAGGHHAH
jgi:5-methylthioadenosine/S-adenosylhomocysteine deaminase